MFRIELFLQNQISVAFKPPNKSVQFICLKYGYNRTGDSAL